MQLSRKPAADQFLKSEEMFCLVSPYNNPSICISHFLGQSRIKSWVSYSVNLEAEHEKLSKMPPSDLDGFIESNSHVVREIKANAFPLISDRDQPERGYFGI